MVAVCGAEQVCYGLVLVLGLIGTFTVLPFQTHVAAAAMLSIYVGSHSSLAERPTTSGTSQSQSLGLFFAYLAVAACCLVLVFGMLFGSAPAQAPGANLGTDSHLINGYVGLLGLCCTFSLFRTVFATLLPVPLDPMHISLASLHPSSHPSSPNRRGSTTGRGYIMALPGVLGVPRQLTFVASDLVSLCATAGLAIWQMSSHDPCSSSLFGVAFCATAISTLSVGGFRNGAMALIFGCLGQMCATAVPASLHTSPTLMDSATHILRRVLQDHSPGQVHD